MAAGAVEGDANAPLALPAAAGSAASSTGLALYYLPRDTCDPEANPQGTCDDAGGEPYAPSRQQPVAPSPPGTTKDPQKTHKTPPISPLLLDSVEFDQSY